MIELKWDPKKGIWSEEVTSAEKLTRNFYGTRKKNVVWLRPEEALYIMNFQNGACEDKNGSVTFNDMASFYSQKEPRFFIKYNAYRDWRDRGLISKRIKDVESAEGKKEKIKKYPSNDFVKKKIKVTAYWYSESLYSVIEDSIVGHMLFNDHWFGQLGVYKQERGELLKLDFMETIFLGKYLNINIINATTGKPITPEVILNSVKKKMEYAKQLYEVYEDWRLRSYVVKTGFKFGTHFRIYFPGAKPGRSDDKWIHSKHVIHIFPKTQKMLVSEWSRAVRVAHGVKKTFILSIPEMKKNDYVDYPADFLAYRRKKDKDSWIRETPKDSPRYLIVPMAEDECIGGVELASLLKKASNMGLELLLSITDRETAITYYLLKQIILPGSKYEYYEIEWMKP
ncbi:MAG: tRNA-intron lyase [Nanoarchaeota archaeon]